MQALPGEQSMLSAEEVRAVPLFSTLEVKELERLARSCEDLHLRADARDPHLLESSVPGIRLRGCAAEPDQTCRVGGR
jgi:hypothetical protein